MMQTLWAVIHGGKIELAEPADMIPNKVYNMPTPYDAFGAGQALMNAMEQAEHGHE